MRKEGFPSFLKMPFSCFQRLDASGDRVFNFLLDALLDMKRIGITLTENGAMHPHASVCGMMLAHPASRYFAVGKIGEDQLQDYARRRGMSVDVMRKFLAANLPG